MRRVMTTRNLERLARAGALWLAAIGALCLLGNQGALLSQPADPVTEVSSRYAWWAAGILCLAAGGARLGFPNAAWPRLLILWLGFSAALLRAGLWWLGARSTRGYFELMAAHFGVAPEVLVWGFGLGWALALGGAVAELRAADGRVRTSCPNCGGRLEAAARSLGREQPCPHCGRTITLRAAGELLKTACYFCQGHIEFPAHALGRKIPCPHCRRDIPLQPR